MISKGINNPERGRVGKNAGGLWNRDCRDIGGFQFLVADDLWSRSAEGFHIWRLNDLSKTNGPVGFKIFSSFLGNCFSSSLCDYGSLKKKPTQSWIASSINITGMFFLTDRGTGNQLFSPSVSWPAVCTGCIWRGWRPRRAKATIATVEPNEIDVP